MYDSGNTRPPARVLSDRDQDGLTDEAEELYHTDPDNPDTDRDGTRDGDEVAAGRNPLLAGEDELKPPTGRNVLGAVSYTARYLATLPEDTARDMIINKDALDAFAADNRGTLIPDIPPAGIATVDPTDSETVRQYFARISSVSNPEVIAVAADDIAAAFRLDFERHDPETIEKIIVVLQSNITIYQQTPVPQGIRSIHEQLIALNEALLTNTQLLHTMPQDFVAGLIAARNLEELGSRFATLAHDMQSIQDEYGIE